MIGLVRELHADGFATAKSSSPLQNIPELALRSFRACRQVQKRYSEGLRAHQPVQLLAQTRSVYYCKEAVS